MKKTTMRKKRCDPHFPELMEQWHDQKISRREFVRYAALLGMSVVGACELTGLAAPKKALARENKIKRGGVLRVSTIIHSFDHPAKIAWSESTNIARQIGEYLTWTDKNNITRPYLLKNWEASPDLKTWTLNLRKGIKFNNNDHFTSDDVIFSLNQWLDPDVNSSMIGLMGGYLSRAGIEKTGNFQVRLHLNHPEIAVSEHLFHYPALILNHRTFEGDFIKAPHGTGPYAMDLGW